MQTVLILYTRQFKLYTNNLVTIDHKVSLSVCVLELYTYSLDSIRYVNAKEGCISASEVCRVALNAWISRMQ